MQRIMKLRTIEGEKKSRNFHLMAVFEKLKYLETHFFLLTFVFTIKILDDEVGVVGVVGVARSNP